MAKNLTAYLLSLFILACEQPFDPRAPLDAQMVVFSIISTDRDVQFVRVQGTYMAPDVDAASYTSDNSVKDAIVSIRASNGVYFTRDTLLARPDTGRYKFPLYAYVLNPFTPERGRSYEVIVQSASRGQAFATVIVPGQPTLSIPTYETKRVLENSRNYADNVPLLFPVVLSPNAKGYVARLLLYYDVLKAKQWEEERVEIPVMSADPSRYGLYLPRYPQMALIPSTSEVGIVFRNGYYNAVIRNVRYVYPSNRIIFKWATFVLLQADRNLYDYFSVTHAGRDPWSIRFDEAMVSRMEGGLGIVGAYTLDSLVNILPSNFWGNQ